MVFSAAHREGLHVVLPSNTTDVRPKPLAPNWENQLLPFFRAEDTVDRAA